MGRIQFKKEVDLTYGNLDRDISINDTYVEVYKENSKFNPGFGKGLN